MQRAGRIVIRVPALVVSVLLVAGCSGPEGPGVERPGQSSEPTGQPETLALVEFDNGTFGRGARLRGCASLSDDEDAGYTLPVLIATRLRARQRLRLLPATYSERSSAIDGVTQYVGPDPGPRAPHLAVSIGPTGAGPTADRLTYDTNLIGDSRNSPAGLDAAQESWAARRPLDGPVSIAPGDHYLFIEVDPSRGMDLHGLTAHWTRRGVQGVQPIGGLSLRVQCGG